MKERFTATLHNFRLAKDETARITFKVPYTELVSVSKCLLLFNKQFSVGLNSEGVKKKMDEVMIDKLSFDRDGEASLTLVVNVQQLEGLGFGFLNSCTQKPVMIIIKYEDTDLEEVKSE